MRSLPTGLNRIIFSNPSSACGSLGKLARPRYQPACLMLGLGVSLSHPSAQREGTATFRRLGDRRGYARLSARTTIGETGRAKTARRLHRRVGSGAEEEHDGEDQE